MTKKGKRYQDMNARELAEATKEFDEPFVFEKARPMSRSERNIWRQALRRGRPKVGKGSQRINVTIERGLLSQADKLARQTGLNRSQLIAGSLTAALARRAS